MIVALAGDAGTGGYAAQSQGCVGASQRSGRRTWRGYPVIRDTSGTRSAGTIFHMATALRATPNSAATRDIRPRWLRNKSMPVSVIPPC